MTYADQSAESLESIDAEADAETVDSMECEWFERQFDERALHDPEPAAVEDARVLIVDDDPTALRLMGRVLERGGFWRVDVAVGGRQALATLRARRPDVLVADVFMPEIDGFALLRALSAEGRPFRVTSVLAISGDANPELRRSILAHGADDFVVRPCASDELVARVRSLAQHAQTVNRALDRLSLLDGLLRLPLDRTRPGRAHHSATRPLDTPFLGGPRRGRSRW